MSMNYIQYLSVSKSQYKHTRELQAVPTQNVTTGSTDTERNSLERA